MRATGAAPRVVISQTTLSDYTSAAMPQVLILTEVQESMNAQAFSHHSTRHEIP